MKTDRMGRKGRFLAVLMGASALAVPTGASAATAREKDVEGRLEKLEQQMAALQLQLAEARGDQARTAAAARAQADAAGARLAALESRPAPVPAAPAAPPAEGLRSGGTAIRLGGYLKMVAASTHFSNGSVPTNTLARDFYLPQAIPTTPGGRGETTSDFTAKQTRLWLNLDSSVAGHLVKGYLEADFQTTANAAQNVAGGGSQRTTNGYTLALRRAFVQVDRFTFGQDWTTFQYTAALPESTDYVGGAEGTVFVRQPQVRFSAPLSTGLTLHVAVENPESAVVTAGSTAMLESGTDHLPDLAARLVYTGKRGELSLAGLARQVRAESTGTGLINTAATSGAAGNGLAATGLGASLGGKLFLNDGKTSDLRFIATYGKNIGRYVGLNFAPDAVYDPATGRLTDVTVLAALAAAHVALSPSVRVNLMGSYQRVSYDKGLGAAQLSGFNRQAWSAAANLFWSPVKNVDLGAEYRHGSRTVINPTAPGGTARGTLDRVELAAKYNF